MNAEKYNRIFIHNGIMPGKCLIGNFFIFQHDNDLGYRNTQCNTSSPGLAVVEALFLPYMQCWEAYF